MLFGYDVLGEVTMRGKRVLAAAAVVLVAFAVALCVRGLPSWLPAEEKPLVVVPEQARTYTPWTEDDAPNYYRVVGPAVVDVSLSPGEITYSGLDYLGRSGRAVACVTHEMMVEGIDRDRDDMQSIRPSGWGHNAEVDIELIDGDVYHGYLYNRSHLIAKSLGGSEIAENLVCGTRMQNVGDSNPAGGMLFCEQVARDWLFQNPDGWVLYSATPVYEGDELLCRSVIVDMRSSDGTLDMQVEVYNAALGYEIDYATGEFRAE